MILVFGYHGQLATELRKMPNIQAYGREDVDLADKNSVKAIITAKDYEAVINAAAYTAVDKAESEPDEANIINGLAPKYMAEICKELDIPLIHISTDYVFAGTGEAAYLETDEVAPQNTYGQSKLLGEQNVQAFNGRYAILRVSWVFSQTGQNFVKTMLRLGRERDELSIVHDQIGGPTPASEIAKTAMILAKELQTNPEKSGIYHYSGAPDVSWAEFAQEIFSQSGIQCQIHKITSAEFPTPAKRPTNSRLNCDKIEAQFSIKRPDWKLALHDVLKGLHAGD